MTRLNHTIRFSLLAITVWGSAFGTAISDEKILEKNGAGIVPADEETRPKEFRVRVLRATIGGRVVEMDDQPVPIVFNARIDEEFERTVFPQDGNAERGKWRINAEINKAIENIDSICQLTLPQKRKLELIARADRKHLFDQFDQLRSENRDAKMPAAEIGAKIELLREQASGRILDADSFFAKSLRLVLSETQFAKLTQAHRTRIQSAIELVLNDLENQVALTQSQRQSLTQLLTEYTPTNFNFAGTDILGANSDRFVMLYTLWLHSEERVKPLLEPEQWKLLQPQLQRYQSFEENLKRRGMLNGANIFAVHARPGLQTDIEERK